MAATLEEKLEQAVPDEYVKVRGRNSFLLDGVFTLEELKTIVQCIETHRRESHEQP